MQNTRGGSTLIKVTKENEGISSVEREEEYIEDKGKGYIETAIYLFNTFGLGVFFDGIQPKLYRAAVNHSVTFYIYELIMKSVK